MDAKVRAAYDASRSLSDRPFESACYAPFVSLYLNTLGDVVACCRNQSYRLGNVTRATLEEATVPPMAPQGTNIVFFDDIAATIQALLSGQVDAAGMSAFAAKSVADRNPRAGLENKFTVRTAYYAPAIRPGDFDLLQFVNTWVFLNKQNGVLAEIYERHTGVPPEDGHDHREALRVDARAHAARHGEVGGRDERLDLEQERPRALERAHDRRARLILVHAPEDSRGIGDAFEAGAGHLEDAELVRRAEAVLDGTEDAVLAIPVAFEMKRAID